MRGVTDKPGSLPAHAVKPERHKPKRGNREGQGWLEVEGSEGSQRKQGDLLGDSRAYWPGASQARLSRSQSTHSSVEAG
jgi:hypothetical protein